MVLVRFVKDVGRVVIYYSFLGDVIEYKGLYSFLDDPSDKTVGWDLRNVCYFSNYNNL